MKRAGVFLGSIAVLLASACAEREPDITRADAWRGEWTGPEGTLLRIEGGQGSYRVTVRNLDGPRTFEGRGVADGLEFERDGNRDVIRATDGPGTGMKWLTEKHDCLVIHPGEGFCRD